MRSLTVLPVLLALALPGVASPHPCETEVAQMKKNLEEVHQAIATLEASKPSDLQAQMLKNVKGKYDPQLRLTTEAQAACEKLVRAENPGVAPPPVAAVAAPPVAAAVILPEVNVAPPPTPTVCFTGCGKDTDCKGDRICVKGECIDPPARRSAPP
ncbi:MAG: hypothetical protein WCK73_00635 [Deltaproteobacteria bacterium]